MLRKPFSALLFGAAIAIAATAAQAQKIEIPWGTSAVGSAGHKALVNLSTVLNREVENINVSVQPAPGAIVTVKGYATGQFQGYYGADIAFYELANDIARFKGFKSQMKREPVQSFWAFTLEVGAAIHARNQDKIKGWRDLSGRRVFTGPLPWDTRAQLERAFAALDVKHEYVEVDLATAGSLLDSGKIDGMIIYTSAESSTAPWIAEASLSADWAALNPTDEELEILKKKGFQVIELDSKPFNRDIHVDKVKLLPFFYGFHVGLEIPADTVYAMLVAIEKNVDELAKLDKSFSQIKANMPEMQRRGVASSIEFVPVHPGLAKYMRERKVWDAKWDDRIAMKTN